MQVLIALLSTAMLFGSPPVVADTSPARRVRFIPAVVVDVRLSALRRQPDQQAAVQQRMRLGRKVYIISSRNRPGQPLFYRVAISRRTRGWVHHGAIAVTGRRGDDRKVWTLIRSSGNSLDRILLCNLLKEGFTRSVLLPDVLLLIGEEADRAAKNLSRRIQTRLAASRAGSTATPLRDFFLNDSSLDRYSRLGIRFEFDPAKSQIVYDKRAYRELVLRYPSTEQASQARKLLGW